MTAVLTPATRAAPVAPVATGTAVTLAGTRRLVRLILRRDRIRLLLWIGGLVALMGVSAQSIASMYGTPQQIQGYIDTVGDNPALVMFAGPGYGFDDPNAGTILVNETALWMALAAAIMSAFLVNRHTRAEEESERADLVRSMGVGRHAVLTATLLVAAGANAAVAIGCAVVTLAFGFPVAGTLALCGTIGLVGMAFAGSTAVAVQIAGTGRAALGLGTGFVGLAFVVRGIGDVNAAVLSWMTPFGWGIGIRSYADERWWTVVGLLAFVVGSLMLAVALSVRRDLGSGLVAARPGRAEAPAGSRHPLGLALRLQRGAVVGWAAALVAAGLVYGSVADDVDAMLADNPELADYLARIGGATLADSYLATALRMLALIIAGFAVSSALRNRSEEAAGYAESMLATPVSRWWWAGSHLVVTVVGTLVLLVVCGFATGISYAVSLDDWSRVAPLTLAALATFPSVLVLAGVATLLFGWLPHATVAAWGALVLVAVVDIFGRVLDLPDWMLLLSPFEHAPAVPAESWDALPIVLLSLLACALFALGLVGFRRRDLATA